MLIKFADDTILECLVNTSEDRISIQNDLNRSENWVSTNKLSLNKEKCKVLHLGRNIRCRNIGCITADLEVVHVKRI